MQKGIVVFYDNRDAGIFHPWLQSFQRVVSPADVETASEAVEYRRRECRTSPGARMMAHRFTSPEKIKPNTMPRIQIQPAP